MQLPMGDGAADRIENPRGDLVRPLENSALARGARRDLPGGQAVEDLRRERDHGIG